MSVNSTSYKLHARFIELLGCTWLLGHKTSVSLCNVDADKLGCVALQDELFASLQCQPNFPCTRAELSEDLKSLLQYVSPHVPHCLSPNCAVPTIVWVYSLSCELAQHALQGT